MTMEKQTNNPTDNRRLLFSVAFLITGNLIGAGILALPVNTGLAGLIPALFGMITMCGMMYFTACVLADEANTNREENFNYPSLYHKYLGAAGKWVAVLANLVILYGLLTAYLTGGTAIITHITGWDSPLASGIIMLGCFLVLTGLTVMGVQLIKRCNTIFMVLIWATFAIIVAIAGSHIEPARFAFQDWKFLPATVPIIITSFHFHNIIPTICTDMNWERKPVTRAILLGMIIGFIMNAIWVIVGIGALPLVGDGSLNQAFHANVPATVPLAQIIGSDFFIICTMAFAFLAIVTSYVANGLGLMGFTQDLLTNFFGKQNRVLIILFAFGPPIVVSYFFPDIFLKAMNLVGGVGIVILFGILPSLIAFKKMRHPVKRAGALLACIIFSAFLVLEIGQECGLLHLHPDVEYWDTDDHPQAHPEVTAE